MPHLACKPLHARLVLPIHMYCHTLAYPCACSLPGCPGWSWAAPPAANPPAAARRKLPGVARQHSTAPTAAAQHSRSRCTTPHSCRPACKCAAGVWGWASADVAAAGVECAAGSGGGWRQHSRKEQLSCGCNKPVRAGLLVACRYQTHTVTLNVQACAALQMQPYQQAWACNAAHTHKLMARGEKSPLVANHRHCRRQGGLPGIKLCGWMGEGMHEEKKRCGGHGLNG